MKEVKGTTSSGFQYELTEESLDNYELLEILSEIDNGDQSKLPIMIEMFLGTEQKEALKEHIRSKSNNGKVSSTRIFEEVSEIFEQTKEVKN